MVRHDRLLASLMKEARNTHNGGSIFQDILELLAGRTGIKVTFEDLTGFTFDANEFFLDLPFRQHCSDLCSFAKTVRNRACVQNKRACNYLALTRETGFSGLCHLGLTEAVEPLILEGKILGIFYFGSIVVNGTEAKGKERILKYCQRRRLAPEPYLERYANMPHLDEALWEQKRLLFLHTVGLMARLIEKLAPPLEAYILHQGTHQARYDRRHSALTRKTTRYVAEHFAGDCTLNSTAKALGCHSVHLSRTFKADVGVNFQHYVHRIRIAHAKRLLHTRNMNVTRVAYEVGYADSSHFCRIFKQATGQTPAEYIRNPDVV